VVRQAFSGFTLLFEALILTLAQQMTFRGISRLIGVSVHRIMAVCRCYVDLTLAEADFSAVKRLAIDETSKARGHEYVTITADAERRAVICVTDGKDAKAVQAMAVDLRTHGGNPKAVESVSIDMSAAFIKGVTDPLPNAKITFDKFHVIEHASNAVSDTRRAEQKIDPSLKGMRWKLLSDRDKLNPQDKADLDELLKNVTTKRTARAWVYYQQLREILDRKQINVMRTMLEQWCTNVMRSKVTHMKEVASMIRDHLEGIVAWARTRQTNGFLEAINGLFQAAKRKARGYTRFETIRTVIFLLAGKLDFSKLNPHVQEAT
jgi:transposase